MKRRTFLQLTGALVASAYLPASTETPAYEYPTGELGKIEGVRFIRSGFDRTKEYGNAVMLVEKPNDRLIKKALREVLLPDVQKHLPRGARYEVRATGPMDYGRSYGIAWYRSPSFDGPLFWPTRFYSPPPFDRKGGYFVIARLRA